MRIINGRWIDESDDSCINTFNFNKFKRVCSSINSLYGKGITYERIDIVCSLLQINEKEERNILEILKHK